MRPANARWTNVAKRRTRAVALVLSPLVGFFGAAAYVALTAAPAVAGPTVAAYGPAGDGLARFVVAAQSGPITNGQLAALRAVPGVRSAQMLTGGRALVAVSGVSQDRLAAAAPGLTAAPSPQGTVTGTTISDPAWSTYGWNLSNTGSNASGQAATAGADDAAPAGWQVGTGRGTVVAVIDTGMAIDHLDLQGALWNNPNEACGSTDTDRDGYAGDCHGWNFYADSPDVTNAGGDDSHGTTVAGAVAARAGNGQGSAGVAPDVTVMPLVIGSGTSVDLLLGAQAIRFAADHGAAVVNASWIGAGGSTELQSAIDYAASKGTVVVVAAGNDSADRDTSPMYPASLTAPNLITVGASTASDTISSFSAYGATTVDLFAPGTHVFSTWNDGGYRLVDGTSIAAPQVAAAAALYHAHLPSASPSDVKAALLADATRLPAFAGKSVTGGRLSLADLGSQAAAVQYSFASMNSTVSAVSPSVTISGTPGSGTFSVQLGLGMQYGGEVMALADQQLTFPDGTVLTTGQDGMVTVPLGTQSALGSVTLTPSTSLADGRYVLVAQLIKDGTAVTQPSAAPLLVGQQYVTPAPTSGPAPSSTPAQPTSGSAAPTSASSSPGSAAPTSAPAGPTTAAPSQPTGTAAPTTGQPTGSAAPTSVTAGAPGPGPSTSSSSSTASAAPVDPTSAPWQPDGSIPVPSAAPAPTSTAAPGSGTPAPAKTYPPTGPFQLTSISPSVVSTAGGTQVTVTGNAVPAGARVRVGPNDTATVVSSSTTQVVFLAPALVAGTYDVYVFAPDGTDSVLAGGLTYVVPSQVPGGAPAPSTSSSPAPSTGVSGPSTAPGSSPAPSQPGPAPDPNAPAPTPAPPTPQMVTGPHGEHLYHSALFGSLGPAIWSQQCSASCSGLKL